MCQKTWRHHKAWRHQGKIFIIEESRENSKILYIVWNVKELSLLVKDPKTLRNSNPDRNALQLLLCQVFTHLANMD